MPEVWIEAFVGKRKVNLFLNSGATDLELVLPSRTASRLGIETSGTEKVLFGGRKVTARRGEAQVEIANPGTGEKRVARLEVLVLPDRVLDRPLLGIGAQEKLRVTPDTVTGEVVFK
jgi:predicted aspartyl protease